MSTKVELYDATLRDGAQQHGINLSVENKLAIAKILDELGVDFIEGGYAGANPTDDSFFERVAKHDFKNAVVTAFGNTRRGGVRVADDLVVQALEKAQTKVVTLVGKASVHQVTAVLEVDPEENLAMVAETVEYFIARGRTVFFDAEHFFDGWHTDGEYAEQVLKVAADAGAARLILCDTNGGVLPSAIKQITATVKSRFETVLGIHAHNDSGTAVANSLAAFEAGALQIQACVNGYGERTGNANLLSIIANLKLKMGVNCVSDAQLASLYGAARHIAEIANLQLAPNQPYVGANAFTHKGGLHAAAVLKYKESYEHIDPALVGNHDTITVSDLAGRGSLSYHIKEFGLQDKLTKQDIADVMKTVKSREAQGYTYENASASLELLLLRCLDGYKSPYELMDFKVLVHSARGVPVNEATIKLGIDGETNLAAGEGNGPVSALNSALRNVLLKFYPFLKDVVLEDYKVRVVDENMGTESVVRVLIETSNGKKSWNTVGSDTNVVQASWDALSDSYEWAIYKQSQT